jgi:hypothetical protein
MKYSCEDEIMVPLELHQRRNLGSNSEVPLNSLHYKTIPGELIDTISVLKTELPLWQGLQGSALK